MKLIDIYNKINSLYPFENQDDYDNSNINIGSKSHEVKKVLVTLDITNDVVNEAISNQVDLIVAHHPVIFNPLKQIDEDTGDGYNLVNLIKNDIAVLAVHTNYDRSESGMNTSLLELLTANNIEISEKANYLAIGEYDGISLDALCALIKEKLDYHIIRYAGNEDVVINKVGIIGGSGGEYQFIDIVKEEDVDVYITGDTKSSRARYAKENNVNLIDVSHNIESIFIDKFFDLLSSFDLEVIKSEVETNPYILK